MDLDITFEGKTTSTAVYIKMDATDQLLLSEEVCQQLKAITLNSRWRSGEDIARMSLTDDSLFSGTTDARAEPR